MARRTREQGKSPLATKIAVERMRAGLTQAELARHTGLSVEAIRRLEGGHQKEPRLRAIANIAHVLALPIEELLEDDWRWTTYDLKVPAKPDPLTILKPGRWMRPLLARGIEPREWPPRDGAATAGTSPSDPRGALERRSRPRLSVNALVSAGTAQAPTDAHAQT
jgi:transcriptional regulator with XRE-family HTH domain